MVSARKMPFLGQHRKPMLRHYQLATLAAIPKTSYCPFMKQGGAAILGICPLLLVLASCSQPLQMQATASGVLGKDDESNCFTLTGPSGSPISVDFAVNFEADSTSIQLSTGETLRFGENLVLGGGYVDAGDRPLLHSECLVDHGEYFLADSIAVKPNENGQR